MGCQLLNQQKQGVSASCNYILQATGMTKPRSKAQSTQIAGLAAIRKAKENTQPGQPCQSNAVETCSAQEKAASKILQQNTRIQDLENDLRAATLRADNS